MGALLASRALTSVLFEIKPADPLSHFAAVALLALAGVVACLGPARRALQTDPAAILRE